MSKIKILSIDGGGIRGIIPGTILQVIEEKIQKKTGNADARLVDHVDFIAGTSTGGIITCGLLTPSPEDPTRPKFSVEEVVNLYHEHGKDIFYKPFWHKIGGLWGVLDEKFPNTALKKVLESQFGDIQLSQLLKPCLITAYEIKSRRAMFFTQQSAKKTKAHDFLVKEVAQATSAAPTYFQAALIKSILGVKYPFIDGGVFANNPSMCAYAETRKMDFHTVKRPTSKDMYLVSLGTGCVDEELSYQKAKNYGLAKWIRPLISIMMSGNSETVSYQLKWLFDAGSNQDGYFRIEPDLLRASPSMDDASRKNTDALREAGLNYVANHEDKIDMIVDNLIKID